MHPADDLVHRARRPTSSATVSSRPSRVNSLAACSPLAPRTTPAPPAGRAARALWPPETHDAVSGGRFVRSDRSSAVRTARRKSWSSLRRSASRSWRLRRSVHQPGIDDVRGVRRTVRALDRRDRRRSSLTRPAGTCRQFAVRSRRPHDHGKRLLCSRTERFFRGRPIAVGKHAVLDAHHVDAAKGRAGAHSRQFKNKVRTVHRER